MDLFRLASGQGSSFSTAARVLNTGANVPAQVFHDGRFDVGGLAGKPGVSGLQTGDIPLSTGAPYFDTEGTGSQDFAAVAADAAAVGLLAPQSDALNDADVPSLTKILPLAFSDFGPGESIRWRLDIDGGTTGADLVGGMLEVEFDNGITASGLLVAVPGNPDAASVTVTADHYLKANVDGAGAWTIAAGALPVLPLGTYEVQALVVDSSGARATDTTSGELRVVDGDTAALGNVVWHDLNGDGIQGTGEPGIANVTVRLLDLAGGGVATTTTDSDGSYYFTAVAPGSYVVEFEAAAELVFTRQSQGGDEALDSDADRGTGRTAPVVLLPGQFNTAIDAGNLRVGDMDLDGDVDFDDIDDFEQGLNDPDDYVIRFGVPAAFKGDIDRDGDQDFDDIKGFTAIINASSLLGESATAASPSDPAGVRAAATVQQNSPTDQRRLTAGELVAVWSQWQQWPDRAEPDQTDSGLAEGDLTNIQRSYRPIRMRVTLDIDDELLKKAARLTGLKGKTALVRRGLESLIASESSYR